MRRATTWSLVGVIAACQSRYSRRCRCRQRSWSFWLCSISESPELRSGTPGVDALGIYRRPSGNRERRAIPSGAAPAPTTHTGHGGRSSWCQRHASGGAGRPEVAALAQKSTGASRRRRQIRMAPSAATVNTTPTKAISATKNDLRPQKLTALVVHGPRFAAFCEKQRASRIHCSSTHRTAGPAAGTIRIRVAGQHR
jgi:hypothetical protein